MIQYALTPKEGASFAIRSGRRKPPEASGKGSQRPCVPERRHGRFAIVQDAAAGRVELTGHSIPERPLDGRAGNGETPPGDTGIVKGQ